MIAASFIFEPGEYDERFHTLNGQIDESAKSLLGYFEDVATMSELAKVQHNDGDGNV